MTTEIAFAKSFLALLDSKPNKISADHIEDPRSYPGVSPYTLPRHPSLPTPKRPRLSSPPSSSSDLPAPPAPVVPRPAGITVTLVSPRNPPFTLSLSGCSPSTTSVSDLKDYIVSETDLPREKVKVLYNKKPIVDSKVLKDFIPAEVLQRVEQEGGEVEVGVMVLGGPASITLKSRQQPQEQKPAEEKKEGGGEKQEEKATVETVTKDVDRMEVDDPITTATKPKNNSTSGAGVLQTEEFWTDLATWVQQRVGGDEGVTKEVIEVFREAWGKRN